MFRNLVESGSHAKDFKRRGSFLAGTLGLYLLLLTAAGVASVYAYNVNLDTEDNLELLAVMSFPAQPASAEPEKAPEPRQAEARSPQAATRSNINVMTPYNEHREVGPENVRETPARLSPHIRVGPDNDVPVGASIGTPVPGAAGNPSGGSGGGVVVADDTEAPERKATPKQEPAPQPKSDKPIAVPSHVLVGKAVSKPTPVYPNVARIAHIQGQVAVQILIDEQGRVVSAQATSGHTLLQRAAVDAARLARFSPTLIGGVPYRVSGVIFYNFVLN